MFKRLNSLKHWFLKLGFWKKIIFIFSINTLIILVVMNVLMEILFQQVNSNILAVSSSQTNEYISISNSLVGLSIANSLLAGMEVFSDVLVQIDSSMRFFRNRSNIYISNLSGVAPYNPPLSSSLGPNRNYTTPAAYFFTPNSTFHNEPYVELLLQNILGLVEQQKIKRINVIYQSLTNPSDIFAVTLPGTSDFTIPSVEVLNNRFSGLNSDFVTITGVYNDSFSTSDPQGKLLAMRTVKYNPDYRILIENEIYQKTFSAFSSKIFYYQTAQIVVFQIKNQNPPQYQLLNVENYELNLSDCFKPGAHEFPLANGTVITAYSIPANQSFALGKSPHIISTQQLSQMNSTVGSFRLIVLVNKDQLSTPNGFISSFVSNQKEALSIVIYGWSVVILLATVGLSIVTGNYIFENLKTLSQKLEEYTKEPSKMHKIIFELKELQCSGIMKKLIDNVATVMQKIEERKKAKNQQNSKISCPLNIAEKEFCVRNNLGDDQKWQEWKKLLLESREKLGRFNRFSPQRNTFAQKQ